ncbi:hypothetical protein VTK26DRAFT_6609 [Humicola hyalothermophila]
MSDLLNVPQTHRVKPRPEDEAAGPVLDRDRFPMEGLGGNEPTSPFLTPTIPGSLSASQASHYSRLSLSPSPSPSPSPRTLSPVPLSRHSKLWTTRRSGPLRRFWDRNRGAILVAVSQLFGALMNLAARLLELESGMHPLQILFARMSLTTILSCLYMWWNKVPHFPLGPKGLRGVLLVRGVSGFFGIYGMWYSMMYLPLAEATVITFLAPMLAGYICHVLLKDPFTRTEQLFSLVALAGVVLIARPTSLFGSPAPSSSPGTTAAAGATTTAAAGANHTRESTDTQQPQQQHQDWTATPEQRLAAILVALVGVLGAAGAYTTIRYIGARAHALITVTYFSVCSTVVSVVGLVVFGPGAGVVDGDADTGIGGHQQQQQQQQQQQGEGQAPHAAASVLSLFLPRGASTPARDYLLLLGLGACGFVMQFLMTAGIGGSGANPKPNSDSDSRQQQQQQQQQQLHHHRHQQHKRGRTAAAGRSNRATAMVYTHMVFAAAFDRWVFGHRMGLVSLVGCGLVVGGALGAALGKGGDAGRSRKGRGGDGDGGIGAVEEGGGDDHDNDGEVGEEGERLMRKDGDGEGDGDEERDAGEERGSMLGSDDGYLGESGREIERVR